VFAVCSRLQSQKIRYRHALAEAIFWDTLQNLAPLFGRRMLVVKGLFATRSETLQISVDDQIWLFKSKSSKIQTLVVCKEMYGQHVRPKLIAFDEKCP